MNREDFPMLKNNIIYFDNAATSLKPKCVIDSITKYYNEYCSNSHRGDYDISYIVDSLYEGARDTLKDFINAKYREEIIFTSGTTESLNMVVNGFCKNYLKPGDEILITNSEHASNVLPWFNLAKKIGCKINYIELTEDYHVSLENVKKVVTQSTKIIGLAQVTNVIGDVRPIKEIAKFAHENNIILVVDGAQSLPHFKVDVQDLDVDFFAASAHKMCGPTGVGFLYGKKELLEKLEPINLGGGMNESFDSPDDVYLKELPSRLEAGTPNIAGIIGFGEAIKYLESIGMDNIERRVNALRKYLMDKLIAIPHINIINKNSDTGIVSFNVDGVFAQDVSFYLNKYGICLRAGNHCAKILKKSTNVKNSLRISLYFYNTEEEINKFVDLLKDKNKILKEMI